MPRLNIKNILIIISLFILATILHLADAKTVKAEVTAPTNFPIDTVFVDTGQIQSGLTRYLFSNDNYAGCGTNCVQYWTILKIKSIIYSPYGQSNSTITTMGSSTNEAIFTYPYYGTSTVISFNNQGVYDLGDYFVSFNTQNTGATCASELFGGGCLAITAGTGVNAYTRFWIWAVPRRLFTTSTLELASTTAEKAENNSWYTVALLTTIAGFSGLDFIRRVFTSLV